MKKLFRILFRCIGAGLLTAACAGNPSKTDGNGEEKPVITVTIEPQRYFTEAIAGDKFNVVCMVPKGASPEAYDPVPQQLVALSESKAYFRVGYIGFEQAWMDRLTDNAPHIRLFDTSRGIDLIFDHSHAAAHGTNARAVEPHIWTSATNARIIARNTLKALCTLDKANEAYYRARHDSLQARIQRTDSLIRERLARPGVSKAFMIYHPALSYFARDYGLKQISIEEDGKEPSPAHLKELIDLCRAEKAHVIFVQPEFDRRNAEIIAKQTGMRIVSINPLSYDWEAEMLNVAEELLN